MKKTIVITGTGGMGKAIAKRIGTGFKLLLCDFSEDSLNSAAEELGNAGYDVEIVKMNVSSEESVENAAKRASELGELHAVIHTDGLSPVMASVERIVEVDLLGTARMLDIFAKYLSFGTVGVFISSMAGYFAPLSPDVVSKLAKMKPDELKEAITGLGITDVKAAYSVSKMLNRSQVSTAAVARGKKSAGVMSISPGIIHTPMGMKEKGNTANDMQAMLDNSPVQRVGTPEDIAGVVEFLISPEAGFMTGSDILVDGGVVAFTKSIGK